MIVFIYVISIVVWIVALSVLSVLLSRFFWVLRRLMERSFHLYPLPSSYSPVLPSIFASAILLFLTKRIWSMIGVESGWLFPTIIAVICLMLGIVIGDDEVRDEENMKHFFASVLGCIVYGFLSLFWWLLVLRWSPKWFPVCFLHQFTSVFAGLRGGGSLMCFDEVGTLVFEERKWVVAYSELYAYQLLESD